MKGLARVASGLTIWLCLMSPEGFAATPDKSPAATHPAVKLSYAPYSKISARRVETMRLTREGKFDAVEALLSPLQQAYEAKQVDEMAVAIAFAPFSTSDEAVGAALDRWVASAPSSYSARLARARYGRQAFYRHRYVERPGSEAAIGAERVREIATRSIADYQAALAKNPRLMIAYADLVEMAVATRDDALLRETVHKGLELAPASWLVRDALLRVGAVPREQLANFLADAARHEQENPLLLQLPADIATGDAKRLWVKGQLQEALAIYDKQLETLDVFGYHKDRARILRVLHRFPEASAAIDHAIALMPGKYDGYRERGWLHLDTEKYAEAAADFRQGLEIDPLDSELNRGLGGALEGTGDNRGAIAAYERSARWAPEAEVFRKIGWLQLHEAKNARASLAALERAVALDPKDKWGWYTRGEALDALGDHRANDSFRHYLALADERSAEDREFVVALKKRLNGGERPAPPPASSWW